MSVTCYDFSELKKKIITFYKFLKFVNRHHKIQVPKGPHLKASLPNIIFGNQLIVSTIKFRKGFSKFMVPIALFEKFGR